MSYMGELYEDREIIDDNQNIVIYGAGGYGAKIYRNLVRFHKEKDVIAFIDKDLSKQKKMFCNIPVISVEQASKQYGDVIVCIGGETEDKVKDLEQLEGMKNIHQIVFNSNCNLYGTEYGGFYLPKSFDIENSVVYSFGIGEDLSFSEAVIEKGGEVYAFDPTPKSVKFVENHRLYSNLKFHFYPYGLSDKDGKEEFYLPKRDDWVSASTILHHYVNDRNVIAVEMKTLRSIMKELGHDSVDILKMDIEGSEFKVIDDWMNPGLRRPDVKVCLMETHERFFAPMEKEYIDKLYTTMNKGGFYDVYGTAKEPTFIKI